MIRGSTSLIKRTPHTPNLVSSPDPLLATGLQDYYAIGFMFTLNFVNKNPSEGV